jgi:hypothetical protein
MTSLGKVAWYIRNHKAMRCYSPSILNENHNAMHYSIQFFCLDYSINFYVLFLLSLCIIGCADNWIGKRIKANYYCYLLVNKTLTWTEAQKACEKHKANLLSLTSEEEFKFVKDKIQKRENVWIGANDLKTEGIFQWTDG